MRLDEFLLYEIEPFDRVISTARFIELERKVDMILDHLSLEVTEIPAKPKEVKLTRKECVETPK